MGTSVDWTCAECDRPGACELCERCAEHCEARKPDDVDAHLALFDELIATTDPKRAAS